MTWHYQATHRTFKVPGGRTVDQSEVREVYEGLNDDGTDAWTEEAITVSSETEEGLAEVLHMMLEDIKHFGLLEIE